MTQVFLDWLLGLIASGDTHPFYVTPEWRRLSAAVLADDHRNCQICRRPNSATLVHHVRHVKQFPALALSRFYVDADGIEQRNLISVCRACHETVCHPERMYKAAPAPRFSTPERWD